MLKLLVAVNQGEFDFLLRDAGGQSYSRAGKMHGGNGATAEIEQL